MAGAEDPGGYCRKLRASDLAYVYRMHRAILPAGANFPLSTYTDYGLPSVRQQTHYFNPFASVE